MTDIPPLSPTQAEALPWACRSDRSSTRAATTTETLLTEVGLNMAVGVALGVGLVLFVTLGWRSAAEWFVAWCCRWCL